MSTARMAMRTLRKTVAAGISVFMPRLAPAFPTMSGTEWAACQPSFSQFGEDRLLIRLLEGVTDPRNRVYVDIGAHDPAIYSNTLLLHKRGWRGINVDASAASIEKFRAARPGDRNVCAAISDAARSMSFFEYPSPAANRIGPSDHPDPRNVLGESPVRTTRIATRALNELLAEQLLPAERIGLLNIDCEGEDLTLIRHLDLARWRPVVIAVETHDEPTTLELTARLIAAGYEWIGRLSVTLIFRDAAFGLERSQPPENDACGSV